eukprot:9452029-Pyramimonas_sp.AAC.1
MPALLLYAWVRLGPELPDPTLKPITGLETVYAQLMNQSHEWLDMSRARESKPKPSMVKPPPFGAKNRHRKMNK